MIIRGAPAIGVAAAMGVAIGVLHADPADLDSQVETDLRYPRAHPSDGGQSFLGDRPHEAPVRQPPRAADRRDPRRAWLPRRNSSAKRTSRSIGRSGVTARHWCRTENGPHALQRRRAGDGRLWDRARRDPRSGRRRQADRRLRRRDTALPSGRAADGVGAAAGQHSDNPDYGQHGRTFHEVGPDRMRGGRGGPDRRRMATSRTRWAHTRWRCWQRRTACRFSSRRRFRHSI